MKKILFFCFLIFLLNISVFPQQQQEETLTLTTYYPSPVGVYNELRSKRMAIGKNYFDASKYPWDTDGVIMSGEISQNTDLVVEGNVGIGTINPRLKLDVAGEVRIGNTNLVCNATTAGTLRYFNNQIQYCDGNNWGNVGISDLCYSVQLSCGTDDPINHVPSQDGQITNARMGEWTPWASAGAESGGDNCASYGRGEVVRIKIYPCP